jgi:hypothetical protein
MIPSSPATVKTSSFPDDNDVEGSLLATNALLALAVLPNNLL